MDRVPAPEEAVLEAVAPVEEEVVDHRRDEDGEQGRDRAENGERLEERQAEQGLDAER
jgi:hypothetical protein